MVQKNDKSFVLNEQLARDVSVAVSETLDKTFSLQVRPGRYEVGQGSVKLNGDVSGIVGLIQDKLEGTLTLCFTSDSVRKLIPRLLGDQIDITPAIITDAVGELTNMVFGQIKTQLNERGHHLRFGMPSVVQGSGHFINHLHEGQFMVIPFEMDDSAFQVHVAIHRSL